MVTTPLWTSFTAATLKVRVLGVVDVSARLDEMSMARWRRMFDINVLGSMLCAREAIGRLQRRGGGAIVNVLSALSWVTLPGAGTYWVAGDVIVQDIAKKLGCSLPQVGNYLKVYQAPKEVRDALAEGRIKSTEAVSIARAKDPLVVLERRLNGEGSTADVIRESGELRPRTATDIRKLCRLYPESPLSKALMEFLRGGDPSALETEVAHYPIEEDGEEVETVETSPADTY